MSSTVPIDQLSRPKIRRHMRSKRKALSINYRLQADQNLFIQAHKSHRLLQAKRILSYVSFEGEISAEKLSKIGQKKHVFLPTIHNYRRRQMLFFNGSHMSVSNQFGIAEPKSIGSPVSANYFDVILLPLVAFDRQGSRLGMGQGYYDRALESLAHQPSSRPYLIGVAHHFQEINCCQAAAWDVPLDAILTDREFINI